MALFPLITGALLGCPLLLEATSSPPPPLADALWPRPQQVQEKTSYGGAATLYNDWIIAYDTTNYNDTFAATELRNFLLEKTNQSLSLPLVSVEQRPFVWVLSDLSSYAPAGAFAFDLVHLNVQRQHHDNVQVHCHRRSSR